MENFLEKVGKKTFLLGNEAIVRGSLEAGVNFVSTYPGTPASEIGNIFFKIATDLGIYFEFSVNEKVAMEAAAGASFSGLRSLVAMKNFGLNVASDFLMPLCYTGIKGGMVIYVADDPSFWSSAQAEVNSRGYAYIAHMPVIEPATPQECKDFTKLAFELSEKFKIPVMIRTTTRAAHQSGLVLLGKIPKVKRTGEFKKEPERFSTMPPRVFEMKKELLSKNEKIKQFAEKWGENKTLKGKKSKIGVIASGICFSHLLEAEKELNLDLPILKLAFFYPLPKGKIKNFIKNLQKILIVEELEGYLEKEIKVLAKEVNPKLKIFGKNLLSEIGELGPDEVIFALAKITGKKMSKSSEIPKLAKRLPRLCPDCPYWHLIAAIKKAVNPEEVVFGGEIGCYMLFRNPPISFQDYLFCMGSSIGIAHGIKKSTNQKLITFVGDSSFFHAGIPALINAVFNKSNPLVIVLDNRTTAMTGHQPYAGGAKRIDRGYEITKEMAGSIKIEDLIAGLGIKNLAVIDPTNQDELVGKIKKFLNQKEVSVIIIRKPCARLP